MEVPILLSSKNIYYTYLAEAQLALIKGAIHYRGKSLTLLA